MGGVGATLRSRLIAALLVATALAAAAVVGSGTIVRPAPLVADGMVLQRETIVTIAGRGRPRWPVVVAGSWGTLGLALADADGAWRATLRTRGAGGPHRVFVWAGGTQVVRDVFVGETWLCSGQSNMDYTVAASGADPGPPLAPDAPPIRLFTVEKGFADVPRTSCGGTWRAATPEAVADFSAVCWSFGRTLHAALGVPIGLVAASVGGTESELWTSERGLGRLPDFRARLEQWPDAARRYEADYTQWVSDVERHDTGWPSWSAPDRGDDAQWREAKAMLVAIGDETTPLVPAGAAWFRTSFEAPPALAGKAARLELPGPLAGDLAWLNGQPLARARGADGSRAYEVPAGILAPASTLVVRRFSLERGPLPPLDGARLRAGDTTIALTGWRGRIGLDLARMRPIPPLPPIRHSLLWNAMIAPLVSYTLRGIVWYQGESNVARAAEYARTFPALIADWREAWGEELPFFFVQLSGYAGYPPPGAITELRDAQRRALAVPATGMVVTTDITTGPDIHDMDKTEVGRRLARWALATIYGRPDVVPSGPLYQGMEVLDGAIRVRFGWAAGGLVARAEPLSGFEVAGEDRRFHPATATIDGETVIVRSREVPEPVAVRYDWSDVPEPSLFNQAGLPASPFRSDDWPGVTDGVAWSSDPGASARH